MGASSFAALPVISIPAPMHATEGWKPFSSPDWLYEIKYDGYRCLARAGGGEAELRTKQGVNCSVWFHHAADGA
jgi:bifunctional non-homologous end joining protein LigD